MLLFKSKSKIDTYCKTPSDYWTINIFDEEELNWWCRELNWWCRELNCNQQEIINIVNKIGDSTCKVKEYLGEY